MRKYDVIVYGATGFTGKLVAEYLQNKRDEAFTWAIAGRNRSKLDTVRNELGLGEEVGVIEANSADLTTLTAMTSQTNVLLTTVGPYAKYGQPLVQACVDTATNYVDITGEPAFVNEMMAKHDAIAKEKQIRIVHCCGFDSIPHDLGAYFTQKYLPANEDVKIEGFVSGSGTFSGGTWHSAVEAMGDMKNAVQPKKRVVSADNRTIQPAKALPRYEKQVKGWVVPLPTIDGDIVLESAKSLPTYGKTFQYGHYARVGSIVNMMGLGVGVSTVATLAQFSPTRNMLLNWRKPGEGPDAETRAKSSFRVTFVGQAGDQKVVCEVRGGDPGYGETSKMVAESALCLALDGDRLPEYYGVVTTATAMGDLLLERLHNKGILFLRLE